MNQTAWCSIDASQAYAIRLDEEAKALLDMLKLPVRDLTADASKLSPLAANSGAAVEVGVRWAHWSRWWEYPWAIVNGNVCPDHEILNAGGVESILTYRLATLGKSVTSLDLDPRIANRMVFTREHALWGGRVDFVTANLTGDPVFFRERYDRVVCCSVLEHVPDPLKAVDFLWASVRPGGRLIVTVDVADYARRNHSVDEDLAREMASRVGCRLPREPAGVQMMRFEEEKPLGPGDRPFVTLRVLGIAADKPA